MIKKTLNPVERARISDKIVKLKREIEELKYEKPTKPTIEHHIDALSVADRIENSGRGSIVDVGDSFLANF